MSQKVFGYRMQASSPNQKKAFPTIISAFPNQFIQFILFQCRQFVQFCFTSWKIIPFYLNLLVCYFDKAVFIQNFIAVPNAAQNCKPNTNFQQTFRFHFKFYCQIDIYSNFNNQITEDMKLIILLCLSLVCLSLDNGVGLTPPMGWNSWNHFACKINQTLIKKTADLLVSTGLAAKGYTYVNLDDCWQIDRNQTTHQIIQDPSAFPSGIPDLAQYVHSKKLKIGLYSDAGVKTCQGRPGSYGYQSIDANTYAKWQIDYLKHDNCNHPNVSAKLRYYAMKKALNQSGRHIFYSMCNWGQQNSATWANDYANSWRNTGDIRRGWSSFISILDKQVGLQVYSGIGGWNDPDMLEVGNLGMTFHQQYAHFALWAALKAPLLIGCSLQNISHQTLTILGNQELIAINQDSLGKQAKRILSQKTQFGSRQIWGGQLSGSRYVVIFLNKGDFGQAMKVSLKNELRIDYSSYSQRDPIKHQDIASASADMLQIHHVAGHSVQVRILKKQTKKQQQLVYE